MPLLQVLRKQRWLLGAAAFSLAALHLQARSPWPSDPALLGAQALLVILGLGGIAWAPHLRRSVRVPMEALLALLAALLGATVLLALATPGRPWPLLLLGWATLLLLTALTHLGMEAGIRGWRRLLLGVSWALLALLALPGLHPLSILRLPILAAAAAWPFWTRRWKGGMALFLLFAALCSAPLAFQPYLRARMHWAPATAPDPLGRNYQTLRVREVLKGMTWNGNRAPLREVPNANTHCAIALLGHSWGWAGVAAWGLLQGAALFAAFRRAWRERGRTLGGLLGTLAMALGASILSNLCLGLGLPGGSGAGLPVLALDPALAFLGLAMVALLALEEAPSRI